MLFRLKYYEYKVYMLLLVLTAASHHLCYNHIQYFCNVNFLLFNYVDLFARLCPLGLVY